MSDEMRSPKGKSLAIAYSIKKKNQRKKMADGGMVDDDESKKPLEIEMIEEKRPLEIERLPDDSEELGQDNDSMVDEIMRKRQAKKMADGGMVDLDENAEEDPSDLDDLNLEALKKEDYSEDSALEEDQPMDSNEHGDELSDEDMHDMVDQIRRKMKAKRGL